MKDLDLIVTLWPSFPHFSKFATDYRLSGIRLNSAMIQPKDLDAELELTNITGRIPLYFDIKGRQLRVVDVSDSTDHLELTLNHEIEVHTPCVVLFKGGEGDFAVLKQVKDGKHLIFDGGPKWKVKPGESLHIRHASLKVKGSLFTAAEKDKISIVKKAAFDHYFLSYVQSKRDVDEFRELIGQDPFLYLKIEDRQGLDYVATKFRRSDKNVLMAARGDLFVEVDKPHQILEALKLIIEKDPEAGVGSRLLLSLVKRPIPEMADLSDLAWLYDIGYRTMMLCDELCLKDSLLTPAVNVLDSFKQTYAGDRTIGLLD